MPHRERQSRRVVVCEDCIRCDSSHHRGRPSEPHAPGTRREQQQQQQQQQYRDDPPRRHQTRGQDNGRASFVGLLSGLFKAAVGTVFGHESTGRSRERSRSRTASPSRYHTRRRDRSVYTSHYSRASEQHDERGHYRHRRRESSDDGRRAAAEQQRRSEERRRRSRSEERRKSELWELRRRERQWLEFWDPSTPPKCLFVRDPRHPAATRVEADRDSSRRSSRAHPSQDYPHGSRTRRPRSPSPRRPVLTEPVYGRRSAREILPQASPSPPRQPSPRRLLPPSPTASQPTVVDRRASVVDVPDDPEDDAQDSAASTRGAQKHVHFDPAVMGQAPSQEASK